MAENKAQALKEANVTTVDSVEYKLYLILGGSPVHSPRRIDITESIPDDVIEEYYSSERKFYDGIAASVIGVQETISSLEISDGVEIPLTNPMGIFTSIQQKINNALQAAIVNERQLNALTGMIDGIFKQCEYERQLGVKSVIENADK